VRTALKRNAISGLIVLTPVFAAGYSAWWVYQLIANFPLVGVVARRVTVLHAVDPSLARFVIALTVLIGLLLLLTWVMRTAIGPILESRLDASFNQIPGFRVVYNASKIAMETVVNEDVDLNAPAKVELWNDARVTAFPTGRNTADGRTTVYIPASPVIFVGWVVELDESRIEPAAESTEDALIRVLSAGFAERSSPPRQS